MIIRNRKSGVTHEVEPVVWDKLMELKMNTLFVVVSRDPVASPIKRINIPSEIRELQAHLKIEKDLSQPPPQFTEPVNTLPKFNKPKPKTKKH